MGSNLSTKALYDKTSVESILEYSRGLIGKTLREALSELEIETNADHKGDLGTLVQTLYFGLEKDNLREPDFRDAGLELKTTGLVERKGDLVAKERLVLSMIDFGQIVNERWESSALLEKCRLILLLAYLYDKDKHPIDRQFVRGPFLLDFLSKGFEGVRADWEQIRDKIRSGRAHELSEGDTFYLGACRKGSGGPNEPLRNQPNSSEKAKARAFSLKQSFLTSILLADDDHLEDLQEVPERGFSSFVGKAVTEIGNHFGLVKKSKNHKGFHRQLAVAMLGQGGISVQNLGSLGIEMKTIRLNNKGKPRESMSFPGFEFIEILGQEWEESSFFEAIESKFLFVVFKEGEDGLERLDKVAYWNMPYADRLEAERVWKETKRRVAVDVGALPRVGESPVAHVRPKGRDGNDKIPTPQGGMFLRQCFWLNSSYIAGVLRSL